MELKSVQPQSADYM